MSKSEASLFPLTAYNQDDRSEDFLKSMRDTAHLYITKKGHNAYEAWMVATCGYIPRNIHETVGLTVEAYKKWGEKGQLVLPPENTLRFCLRMGIHPAHLVPGFFEKEQSYPEAIVNLMTNLLKEKPKRQTEDILNGQSIATSDRSQCIAAFSSELYRYQKRCESSRNFRAYTLGTIQNISREKLGEFRIPGLEKVFSYAVGYHASDIDAALDFHETNLIGFEKEWEVRSTDQSHLLAESRSRLEYLGGMLYGEKRAGAVIDQIVKVIDSIPLKDRIEFWVLGQDDIVDDLNDGANWDSILNFPSFSPDYELNCMVEHCDIDRAKEEFLSELRNYHAYLEDFRLIKDRVKLHFNGLNEFQKWKGSVMTQEVLIPQFRNYFMIRPYLEEETERAKQKLLPDYSQGSSRNPA